jgi:hypothetical protein
MPKKIPIHFKELMKILKKFDVIEKSGGKGSEVILQRVLHEGPKPRGPQYTIKKHGANSEIDWRIIRKICQVFNIPENAIWSE